MVIPIPFTRSIINLRSVVLTILFLILFLILDVIVVIRFVVFIVVFVYAQLTYGSVMYVECGYPF